MKKEPRTRSKPWTFERPNQKDRPRGSADDFRTAIELLGPFHFATNAEADTGQELGVPPYPGEPRLWWFSREAAENRIIVLAENFNWQTRLERNAPRVANVAESLRRVEEAADTLRRTLLDLDDYARSALRTAGSLVALPEGQPTGMAAAYFRACGGDMLPPLLGSVRDRDSLPLWTDILEALSRYAGMTATNFTANWGDSDPDRPDLGGNTNLLRRERGNAKWQLSVGAWDLFEQCQPGKASGTEGGPFYNLVAAIYQLSTGEPAEETTGLDSSVKRVAGLKRRTRMLRRKRERIDEEIFALRRDARAPQSGAAAQELSKRSHDLVLERMKIEAALEPLVSEIYTGVRPFRKKGKYPPE